MKTTSNTEYYGGVENPWENDMSETRPLLNVGEVIKVQVGGSVSNKWGGIDDWEAEVDIAVTEDMLDSWERWGSEYKTFADMVLKVHDEEVREALDAGR